MCFRAGRPRRAHPATCAQCEETLPEDVLGKMHAAPKADAPLADVHTFPEADGALPALPSPIRCPSAWRAAAAEAQRRAGFLFGFPTRRAPRRSPRPMSCAPGPRARKL